MAKGTARPVRRVVRDFLEDQTPRRTQRWLAHRVGISEAYLSDILYERNEPSLGVALELSRITGVPVERFARG